MPSGLREKRLRKGHTRSTRHNPKIALCRSECRFTAFLIPAAPLSPWNSRLSCRVVNG